MFMRESEGVYQFGTKRVYVKCVKDKIEKMVQKEDLSFGETGVVVEAKIF